MKNKLICLLLFMILYFFVDAQNVVIRGRVRCVNQNIASTKGAENVIVIPGFTPAKSSITASNPAGYFEINTGVPIAKLQDKQVTVYIISNCKSCPETVKRLFVSDDQDPANSDAACYITVKEWKFNKNCNQLELSPLRADSVLRTVIAQPAQTLTVPGSETALVGTPAFLNLITTITTALPPVGPGGVFKAAQLYPGKMHYGEVLFASPMILSGNTGFNFSPSRDMSEAMFWNPSAIAMSKTPYNISLFSNVKNNVKVGGYANVAENVFLSAGFIYTTQNQFRGAIFNDAFGGSNTVATDSLLFKLKEFAAFLSPSVKLTNTLSLGVTVKSIWQQFNIPNSLVIDNGNNITSLADSSVKKQKIDVDFSVTYKITSALQAGINVMNIAGTKLYADAFVPGQQNIAMHNLRSYGVGLCYKWQRFNFGADALFTDKDFYDATIGVNYVPFNNALISAGFAVKQLSYSATFKIKHFRIAYIDDNKFMFNERKSGRSGILNGRIYGGFSFNF